MSYIIYSGTTGTDGSLNAAAVPIGGYSLLGTIGLAPRRNCIEVQNQSTQQIQLVRDDGAGGNQTSLILAGAAAAGGQGGSWQSYTFKGRLRIYGPSGSQQVAVYQD